MARPLSSYRVAARLETVARLVRDADDILCRLALEAGPEDLAAIEAVRGLGDIDIWLAQRIEAAAKGIENGENDRLARMEAESADYERQMTGRELDQLAREMPTPRLLQAMGPDSYARMFGTVR